MTKPPKQPGNSWKAVGSKQPVPEVHVFMLTTTQPERVRHLTLYDVSWDAYDALLSACGSRRLRHTYVEGVLEIMSPLRRHGLVKKYVARLIEMMAFHLDIEIESLGSTTLRKPGQ